MSFELTILGCGSATPTSKQFPTAQLLKMQERFFLVDCGEGAQQQLRRSKAKFSRINHIFISHLHGDHFFGLPGLLSSFHLLNRSTPLHIYGPSNLKAWLDLTFGSTNTNLVYPLVFHETQNKEKALLFEDDKVEVFSFPLRHSIATTGFLFQEKPKERNILKSKIDEYNIEICDIQNIKNGKDWIAPNGKTIANTELTKDPTPPLSYAYCSDTSYLPKLNERIHKASLLYHESTFLDVDKKKAKQTKHSTALQAGKIATLTESENLMLGHYSVRYDDREAFKAEAQQEFNNTFLARDLRRFTVSQDAIEFEDLNASKSEVDKL
jgi:ribonuclease Z